MRWVNWLHFLICKANTFTFTAWSVYTCPIRIYGLWMKGGREISELKCENGVKINNLWLAQLMNDQIFAIWRGNVRFLNHFIVELTLKYLWHTQSFVRNIKFLHHDNSRNTALVEQWAQCLQTHDNNKYSEEGQQTEIGMTVG